MRKFLFYDTDSSGEAEFDISDDSYISLMNACFQYCVSVSFRVHPYVDFPEFLNTYRIPTSEHAAAHYRKIGEMGVHTESGILLYHTGQFKLTDEVKMYILCASKSLFGWTDDNPEDIAFYRADGTIFLHSSTHNGICVLTPRDNEKIDGIISNQLWTKSTESLQ